MAKKVGLILEDGFLQWQDENNKYQDMIALINSLILDIQKYLKREHFEAFKRYQKRILSKYPLVDKK